MRSTPYNVQRIAAYSPNTTTFSEDAASRDSPDDAIGDLVMREQAAQHKILCP